ncbi:MAG TPA: DNA helicase, partial [Sediminispirochaeta sp.]|nr:DNA helicase [Sediminispirochaeta sp.]
MAISSNEGPLIVQGDSTMLLDVHHPQAEEARADLGLFAELEKSPEHMHTYRLTPLSLWNAASAGYAAEDILGKLEQWSRFGIPENIDYYIHDLISRYGKLQLRAGDEPDRLFLKVDDPLFKTEIERNQRCAKFLQPHPEGFSLHLYDRGTIKSELIKLNYPVKDEAPLREGAPFNFKLLSDSHDGYRFQVRDYQEEAARAFYGDGRAGSGFGTVVLPCGSGKTIVGMKAMELAQT